MQCGLYELDITPHLGRDIPGQFYIRRSEGIREKLYAHALYICNGAGKKVVIVSADVILLPSDMAEEARSTIASNLGIGKECILLAATHSHTAGPVWSWDEFAHCDPNYIEFLKTRIIDAATLAAAAQREVKIGYAKGYEDRIAFYRDFVMADGRYQTNPGMGGEKRPYGTIDPEVGVLRIDNADGTPYGVVVNYACHCDCVGGNEYSSDYPGAMKGFLRNIYGNNFIPLFINGFCGNINHCDFENGFHQQPDHYRRMGRMLAAEVIRTREVVNAMHAESELGGAHEYMTIPTREPNQELLTWADGVLEGVNSSVVDSFYAREAKRYFDAGMQLIPVVVQALRIGDLALYGMPGEIYVEYAKYLKQHSPSSYTMTANLANGCAGYVPTRELFQPGIYEARLCSSSQLVPEAGCMMCDRILALSKKLWQMQE